MPCFPLQLSLFALPFVLIISSLSKINMKSTSIWRISLIINSHAITREVKCCINRWFMAKPYMTEFLIT
uniref:Putative secreted protein n=1 Tax=Panstrongylus lignarius TaxID=156445 RepID=A0A224XUS6_9HEMI